MILALLMPLFALATPVVGVGLGLEERGQQVLVREVIPNTPAFRNAAIHPGDRIVAVQQFEGDPLGWLPVSRLDVDEVVQLVRGKAGVKVGLRLEGTSGIYQLYLSREAFDAP